MGNETAVTGGVWGWSKGRNMGGGGYTKRKNTSTNTDHPPWCGGVEDERGKNVERKKGLDVR